MTEYVYRYVDDSSGLYRLEKYRVIKYTEKGMYIEYEGRMKFVLLTAKRKFAHKNIPDALKAYNFRKCKQVEILKTNLRLALIRRNLSSKEIQEIWTEGETRVQEEILYRLRQDR